MTVDAETPPVTTPETAIATRPPSAVLLERWIESGDAELAIKRIDAMAAALDKLTDRAIRRTYPSDWVIHVSTDQEGKVLREVGYLQDCGADRAGKPWGIEVDEPTITKEDMPDGSFTYIMRATARCKVTGELATVEGSRWSGDTFFTRRLKEADEKVDPSDVRKAAYANLHGRAVRALAGLTAVPVKILRASGVDTEACIFVGYDRGAKGGTATGAGVGGTVVVVGFGNKKDTPVTDLSDKDLNWYLDAYAGNVKDPAKVRYVKQNQRVLDALMRERERRDQSAQHAAATEDRAAEASPGQAPAAASGSSEAKHADVWARLTAAAGTDRRAMQLLKAITVEMFGLEIGAVSGLNAEQLDRVASIPEANLATVVKTLK
jgi:hypothetical protein